jgi:hypothetical protein
VGLSIANPSGKRFTANEASASASHNPPKMNLKLRRSKETQGNFSYGEVIEFVNKFWGLAFVGYSDMQMKWC